MIDVHATWDDRKMTDKADIDKLACAGADMPDDLTTSDQLLFLKLKYLYALHRLDAISTEQGRVGKIKIDKQHGLDKLWEGIWKNSADICNRLSPVMSEANKSDCERCKRLVAIFTGLER